MEKFIEKYYMKIPALSCGSDNMAYIFTKKELNQFIKDLENIFYPSNEEIKAEIVDCVGRMRLSGISEDEAAGIEYGFLKCEQWIRKQPK